MSLFALEFVAVLQPPIMTPQLHRTLHAVMTTAAAAAALCSDRHLSFYYFLSVRVRVLCCYLTRSNVSC